MSRVQSTLDASENQFRLKSGGNKTAQWEAARRILKERFRQAGIEHCEATFPHECTHAWALSFAHSKRRADIVGDEIYEVALLCPDAHRIADARPKAEMTELIRGIIAARQIQP